MEPIPPTEFAKDRTPAVQQYSLVACRSVSNLFRPSRYFADLMQPADAIGFRSLPIAALTGFFAGRPLATKFLMAAPGS
jgi:ABC-type transporter Mla maintaining outer membrane lipid asymmetry permease subunit MlaE